MEFVKRTISPYNGPYVIIAWTQYPVLIDLFKKEIMKSDYIPKPLAIIDLEKSGCMQSLNKIKNKIKEKINDKELIEILLQWENHATCSSYDVLNKLADISKQAISKEKKSYDEFSSEWNSELEKHIYLIAKSYLGKNIRENKNLLMSAQFALTPIFQYHIEYRIKDEIKTFGNLTKKIFSNNTKKHTPKERASMNTFFLLTTKKLFKGIKPGSIYPYSKVFDKFKCKEKGCYTNKIKVDKSELVGEFYYEDLKKYNKRKELIKQVKIIMMEITPECDYAQQNMRGGKFVFGVLWPETLSGTKSMDEKIRSKANYIYNPLPIIYKEKIYYLTFNSRYFFNVSLDLFNNIEPILVARKELLVDVQHWFSKHISRPGKTEF